MVRAFSISLLFLACFNVFAVETTPEQFFYNQGYEDGYKEGYKKGFEEGKSQAISYYKKLLEAYKADLMALEAGKYMDKNNLITYPRVYRILKEDGTVEIKIMGCRIEDLRDVEKLEVSKIPIISERKIQMLKDEGNDLLMLPYELKLPEGIAANNAIIVELPISAKEALNRQGIPYVYNEKTGKIKAVFSSKEKLNTFCKLEEVCK